MSITRLTEKLAALREREGKSQVDVARALRWSQAKMSRVETGASTAKAVDLEALLVYLNASPADRQAISMALRSSEE